METQTVYRFVFLDEAPPGDVHVPAALSNHPYFAARLPFEDKLFLGAFKVDPDAYLEFRSVWRGLVATHGAGTYNWFDFKDEKCEREVSPFWRVLFVCSEDVEAMRLGLGAEALSDARVAELAASFEAAAKTGDAAPAEVLALELERRKEWRSAQRVLMAGFSAPDYDQGIWIDYLEEKVAQRNIQRRLRSIGERVHRKLNPGSHDDLEDLRDCGEADPDRNCQKCGKVGALGAEYGFCVPWLCYTCRRLPKSEWPKPESLPQISFFQNYQKFTEGK